MVRPQLLMESITAFRTQKYEYVVNLYPRAGSNLSAARAKPAHPSCVRSDSERIPLSAGLSFSRQLESHPPSEVRVARHERTPRRLSAIHDALQRRGGVQTKLKRELATKRRRIDVASHLGDSDVFLDLDLALPKSLEKTSTAAFAPAAPPLSWRSSRAMDSSARRFSIASTRNSS